MKENTANLSISTRKSFNWKLFWLLCILNIFGLIALIPLSFSLGPLAVSHQAINEPIIYEIAAIQIGNAIIYSLFIGVGLLFANRSGLGAPILVGWIVKRHESKRIKGALKAAITVGITLPVINLLIIILTRLLENKTTDIGFFPGSTAIASRWQLCLGGISAGITEEILFRLFLFSFFAWLGIRIVRIQGFRSKETTFWIANILSSFLFGLYHLSTARLDVPMSVFRSIGLNCLGGLAFGWLYWKKGLESTILAHTAADIIFYVITPYFISF